jgi:hypothetical protein
MFGCSRFCGDGDAGGDALFETTGGLDFAQGGKDAVEIVVDCGIELGGLGVH